MNTIIQPSISTFVLVGQCKSLYTSSFFLAFSNAARTEPLPFWFHGQTDTGEVKPLNRTLKYKI